MPVNETALRQTEAAIQGMQDALSNATVLSLGTGLQRLRAANGLLARVQQRAAAFNATAAPLR